VAGPLGDVVVPTSLLGAKATTTVDFVANLSADWPVPTGAFTPPDAITDPANPVVPSADSYNMSKVTVAFDSLGREHTVTQYFIKDAVNPLQVNIYTAVDGTDMAAIGGGSPYSVLFDSNGQLDTVTSGGVPYTNTLTWTPGPASAMSVVVDYTGTTFQRGESTTSTNAADGNSAGSYVGVELDTAGNVVAKYSNGEKQAIARVALATFPNEDALTPVNETSWQANVQSGTPNLSEPGRGVAGALTVASLETSNVDITAELVSLMTSQRNYQANSKVITAENQMLQSLMQAL